MNPKGAWSTVRLTLVAVLIVCFGNPPTEAMSSSAASPLPPPSGRIVKVASEPELQEAVRSLESNTTIVLAPGTYKLTSTLWLARRSNISLRGATDNRDDVVVQGPGMTVKRQELLFGIASSEVHGLLIANMTIRDFYDHPIILNAGTQDPHIYNTHLINAGQQFIKSNPDTAGNGVNHGIVEFSLMEYATTSRDSYTNGIDVHHGVGWIIRHNMFRNITAPSGQLAGPAVLMWNGSRDTITEGNTFINCQRAIAYGLDDKPDFDHYGGVIRNNFIYRSAMQRGDVAIIVNDSPFTTVVHNTIILSGTYPNGIEYRFPDTTGVLIANNLLDARITARDGAVAIVNSNVTTATASMFVNAGTGDLHLRSSAVAAISRARVSKDAPVDWDNEPRPQGDAAADVGADQLVAGNRYSGIKN